MTAFSYVQVQLVRAVRVSLDAGWIAIKIRMKRSEETSNVFSFNFKIIRNCSFGFKILNIVLVLR